MKENLTEINNPLIKESKFESGETTYNEEKFPKSVSKDAEKDPVLARERG